MQFLPASGDPGLPSSDPGFWGSAYPTADHPAGSGAVAVLLLVLVGMVVFGVVSAARNHGVMKRGGLDPMTAQSQIAVDLHRVANDRSVPAPKASATLEERLAELDDLAARGVISEAERADARAKLLSAPLT